MHRLSYRLGLARPLFACGAIALAVAALSGCFTSLQRTQELAGEVRGLWDGAGEVVVQVSSERGSFVTSQSRNGEIAFARSLPTGTAYTVAVAESPPDHTCAVTGGGSGVASEASELIVVSCIGPDARVTFGGAWGWTFDPSAEVQAFAGSLLTQQALFTASSGEEGMTAQLDGKDVPLGSGVVVPLVMGETLATLVFTRPDGLSKTYQLQFQRGAREPELVKELVSTVPVRSVAIEDGLVVFAGKNDFNGPVQAVAHERVAGGWSAGITTTLAPQLSSVGEPWLPLVVQQGIISLVQGENLVQLTRTAPGTFSRRADNVPRSELITSMVGRDEELFVWSSSGAGTSSCQMSLTPHTVRKLALRTSNEQQCRRPSGHGAAAAVLAVTSTRVFAVESAVFDLHVLDRALDAKVGITTPSGVSVFRLAIAADDSLVAVWVQLSGGGTAVELFRPEGSGWASAGRLVPSAPSLTFGAALALEQGVLAIGDPDGAGAVHLMTGAGGSWALTKRLTPAGSATSFGTALALSRDTLVVASQQGVHLYR